MTQPKNTVMDAQQEAMIEMYGPPPPMPEVKNNPGVGRPPGSSTDPVNIPVPGSPVLDEVRPDNKPENAKTKKRKTSSNKTNWS